MNLDEKEEISLAISFPLPFRVLVLTGLGILGWATNLHGLSLCNINPAQALELRDVHRKPLSSVHLHDDHPKRHYNPVYRILWHYTLWCSATWLVFKYLTRGNPVLVDVFAYIPGVAALVVALALVCPFNVLQKPERDKFLQAMQRCFFPATDGQIYFSDVILADIFTSFAKVLGDVWLTARMLVPGNSLLTLPSEHSWIRWVMPTVMSLPYLIRFRQCIREYGLLNDSRTKPLFNALKYATAFPVIYLSAAQRIVILDLVKERGGEVAKEAWHGEHRLFRLWLLAAFANSLYSFWWDITNDWGLRLLKPGERPNHQRLPLPHLHSGSPLLASEFPENHHRPVFPDDSVSRIPRYPYGLRPKLLYPLPVYPLLIFLNLVLRLTWSIKLSSHLHSKTDGSSTIFWLEIAEILRRWVWVFIRVEWEVVKRWQQPERSTEPDYEMVYAPDA